MKHKFSLRKKILIGLCAVMVIGFLAHRQILRAVAHAHFNRNDFLNKEETEYAKRCYGYLMKHPDDSEPLHFGTYNFDSDLYKKWGLGNRRLFIKPEKQYILRIEYIGVLWMYYEGVDLNNLDVLEENFLQKIHDYYGQRPLRPEEFLKFIKDNNSFFDDADFATYEYMLVYLSEILDFTEIDDHIIIFMHRLGPVAVF
jgi:hypothetical protein